MCEPTTIMMGTMGIMAAASMATSFMQIQNQNALAGQEIVSTTQAAQADYSREQIKEQQVIDQEGLEEVERMRQGMRERAKARVLAGESGVAGITPIREQANSFLQQAYDIGIMQTNRNNKLEQVEAEKQGIWATASGRLNQAAGRTTNPFMAGLQIVTSGVSGAASGMTLGNTLSKGSFKRVAA